MPTNCEYLSFESDLDWLCWDTAAGGACAGAGTGGRTVHGVAIRHARAGLGSAHSWASSS